MEKIYFLFLKKWGYFLKIDAYKEIYGKMFIEKDRFFLFVVFCVILGKLVDLFKF